MIKIIDYGLGNLSAFLNVYKRLNKPAELAGTPDQLKGATKLVLPGVGAFDQAMNLLNASGMRETLDRLVIEDRMPVIGICVGMQILARGSDEGVLEGLGWIDGRVRSFRSLGKNDLQLPHMGWNDVRSVSPSSLFDNLNDARFYFLHSYFFDCDRSEDTIAVSNYGAEFSCAVRKDNIFGVQFHPEKSHRYGTQLLKNFSEA